MQKCLELAAIEVSPHSLFRVIVNWQQLTTDRTRPFLPTRMLDKYVDSLSFNGQINLRDGPWRLKAQKMAVKIGIVHGSPLSKKGV
jgi:hypothetical protein